MFQHACPECGDLFHSKRGDGVTCGPRCRQRAKRRRDAAVATRDARIRDLVRLHTAVMEEGLALLSMDAVNPELDRIADEIDSLLALGARS